LRITGYLAVLAVFAQVAPTLGAPDQPVTRYVLDYSEPGSMWEIDSGAQRLTLKRGLALAAGDCVILHDVPALPSPRMTVIVDGSEIAVDRQHPRYCVADTRPASPVALAIARTFAALAGVFHDAEEDYDAQRITQTTTRDIDISGPRLPLLAGSQLIVQGRRALALIWSGGTPPYTVSIARSQGPVLATVNVAQAQVELPATALAQGTYSIIVTDAAEARRVQTFSVVATSAVPLPSADIAEILADPSIPLDVRATYDAARLMAIPSNRWWFEAYQRIVDQQDDSELARRLAYELSLGPGP
jgi:hypothetical protein